MCLGAAQLLCGTPNQVPTGPAENGIAATLPWATSGDCVVMQILRTGPSTHGGARFTITDSYSRIVHRNSRCTAGLPYTAPETPYVPGAIPGFPMPWGLPQWADPFPDPLGPEPLPVPKPLHYPDPAFDPESRPRPRDKPAVVVVAPPGVLPGKPSIDLGPDGVPRPGWHEQRPPKDGEGEKKKRLTPGQSALWLEKLVNSFTETDDIVAAIYRALPWQVRRWRGRDGVWRERDITTKQRMERIYSSIGSLSVKKAVDNLIQDYLTDMAFGKVGNQMKKNVRSPERQDELFIKGRTKARPWQSAHQYGLAADFVPYITNQEALDLGDMVGEKVLTGWSWHESHDWPFLRQRAEKHGLSVPIAWDKCHVEYNDFRELLALLTS